MTVKQGATTDRRHRGAVGDGKTLTFTPTAALPADTDSPSTVTGVGLDRGRGPADQTGRSAPSRRSHGATSLFDAQTPATPSVNDSGAGRARHGVHAVGRRHGHGDPVLQGHRQHRHPHRLDLVVDRDPARRRSRSPARPHRLADGDAADPGARSTAGQTYVVSYYAPTATTRRPAASSPAPGPSGPLTAPAGNNGRYRYGAGGGFPTGSWNATNYFVDVVFRPATSTDLGHRLICAAIGGARLRIEWSRSSRGGTT